MPSSRSLFTKRTKEGKERELKKGKKKNDFSPIWPRTKARVRSAQRNEEELPTGWRTGAESSIFPMAFDLDFHPP